MPKRATPFDLTLPVREPGAPAYRWLYTAVRGQILEGRLRPGARLPGTRDLGNRYGLSRGTVVSAFEQLKAEGYVEGTVGSGTCVSKTLPEELLRIRRPATVPLLSHANGRRRTSDYSRRLRPFPVLEVRPSRAFRPNLPALDLFPLALWAQITARRLRRASTGLLLGCGPMGYEPLRAAVADYVNASRGVRCVPEQVAIVSGVQEALDLCARLLLNPGDLVALEEPGYPGAALAFEALGARVSSAPVDDEGLVLGGPALRGARLVYVTPAHQFPLGITMSLPRRLALLDWARKSDAWIFEDDYDGEYRYSTRPVPALQGLDRGGRVVFAGSFNKVLFPSLRMGYLVLPKDLVEPCAAARSVTSRHPPLLEQAVLCDFITEGHFGRHLRRMREVYAERLSVLLECARERLAGLLEISTIEAGLQTAGWLADGLGEESAEKAARAREVEVTPLGGYRRGGPGRAGLQLGFAAVDVREIRRGARELAIALEGERKRSRRRSTRG